MLFIEARNWSRHIPAQPKRWIVVHSMEAPEASTTARNTAEWFAGRRGPAPRASAHYCVDAVQTIQCVAPERVAWHAPGANQYGIGIELAGYARQTLDEWLDDYSQATLRRAALLSAQLCQRFGIPVEFCPAEDLLDGEAGFTTHAEVGRAWKKTTHSDPGPAFPMGDFLAMVRASAEVPQ